MNSRTKGNKFENDVCRKLSTWAGVSPSTPIEKLPFRRRTTSVVPVVGHWRGAGDLVVAEAVSFAFCVECKKHEGWVLDHLFLPSSRLWDWWDQTRSQAERADLRPLLVFTRNFQPDYVMLRKKDVKGLRGMLVDRPGSRESVLVATLEDLLRTTFPRNA